MKGIFTKLSIVPEDRGPLGYKVTHKTLLSGPWATALPSSTLVMKLILVQQKFEQDPALEERLCCGVVIVICYALVSKQMHNSPVGEQGSLSRQESAESLFSHRR